MIPCIYCNHKAQSVKQYLAHMEQSHYERGWSWLCSLCSENCTNYADHLRNKLILQFGENTINSDNEHKNENMALGSAFTEALTNYGEEEVLQYLNESNTIISGISEPHGSNLINESSLTTDEEWKPMEDESSSEDDSDLRSQCDISSPKRHVRKSVSTNDLICEEFGRKFVFAGADAYITWSVINKSTIQEYYEHFKHNVKAFVNKVNVTHFFDTEQFRPIIVALSSPEAIGFRLMISFEALNHMYDAIIKLLCHAYPNFDVNLTEINDALKTLKNSGIQVLSDWNRNLDNVFRSRRWRKRKAEDRNTVCAKKTKF